MLKGKRDEGDLDDSRSGDRVHGQADPFHGNRSQRDRNSGDFVRDAEVEQPGVAMLGHGDDLPDPVDMALYQMAPQAIAHLQGPFKVHFGPFGVLGERSPLERGTDHVDLEPASPHLLHRQAGAIDRDALALFELLVRGADPQGEPGFAQAGAPDYSDGGYDSGKHGSLSATSKVSCPRMRRSTTCQRSASTNVVPGNPATAGIPVSPSQTGDWIQ